MGGGSGGAYGFGVLSSGLVGPNPAALGKAYSAKVLDLSPIAYYYMDETSGTDADNAEGTAARDGTYVNTPTFSQTGIGDGRTSTLFTGASAECVDVYSASFNTAFDGAEHTVGGWAKVRVAGVWTDSTQRYFCNFAIDNPWNSYLFLEKTATDNQLHLRTDGGGTANNVWDSATIPGETGWFHIAATRGEGADEVKFYINGSQSGATQTTTGTWGATGLEHAVLAAETNAGAKPWDGPLAHWAVWDSVLTAAQILTLATV